LAVSNDLNARHGALLGVAEICTALHAAGSDMQQHVEIEASYKCKSNAIDAYTLF
jgi:hypothetical protein